MTDKSQSIELARQLATTTDMSIDLILNNFSLTQEEYRKVHPDTPISPALALDILDARDVEGMTIAQIQRKWSLSNSQLHYALYNDNATRPKQSDTELPRARVVTSLREGKKSQTEIAEEHGVSQSFVHKIAKEYGLLPNNRKKRVVLTIEQKDSITAAVADGKPVEHLARKYGVSRDTIYKFLRGNRG